MNNQTIKKLFQQSLNYSITVFSCVLIITLGIVILTRATVTTSIGEDITTNNLTAATTTLSGDLDLNLNQIKNAVLEKLADFPSSPVEGQMFWSTATTTPYWYDATNTRWRTQSHGATFVVAAATSTNRHKADYLCNGTADDVEIQAAFDALPSGGGKVVLLEGTFSISSAITVPSYTEFVGSGFSTVLDVSGASFQSVITLNATSTLRNMKIQGSISPLPDPYWHSIDIGNDVTVEHLWMDQVARGLSIQNGKTNVRIQNCFFTQIRDSSGFACPINIQNSSDVFISDVYIADCQRGIEVEDGSNNVYAQRGFLYRIRSDDAGWDWTKVLDVHSHSGNTKCTNVTYRDFYLEDTFGLTADGTNGEEGTYPENILFENITIVNPWNPTQEPYFINTIGGQDVTFKDIKISGATGSYDAYLFKFTSSDHIMMDNINVSASGETQIEMSNSTNIVIKNSKFKTEGSNIALYLRDGEGVLVDNLEIKDYINTALQSDGDCDYLTIKNSRLSSSSTSPGDYGIRTGGDYVKILGNNVLGSNVWYGIRVDGSTSTVSGNFVDKVMINSGTSGNRVFENRISTSLTDDGTGTVIYKNVGYTTENSGTATIASGNTSIQVAHGLSAQPATSTINVIPANNLGNASSTSYWVSDVDASNFYINVGIDPGADEAKFSWQIGSY